VIVPFIRRSQIDPSVRQQFEVARKAHLRQSLLDPSLTSTQVKKIRAEIQMLGRDRVYDGQSSPKAGAILFSTTS
jgi:hypothetical protein